MRSLYESIEQRERRNQRFGRVGKNLLRIISTAALAGSLLGAVDTYQRPHAFSIQEKDGTDKLTEYERENRYWLFGVIGFMGLVGLGVTYDPKQYDFPFHQLRK